MKLRSSLLTVVVLALCAAPSSAGPQPPAGWTDGYVVANGIRIHYWRTGGNKPALVMAHGSSDDGLCWTNLAREFQDQYDIIMFDARGHGLSDPPTPADPPDVQVEDLAGLIKELKLVRPLLMGHSMGSSSVARFAAKYPDVARAVILEDPGLVRPATPAAAGPATQTPEQRRMTILARNSTERRGAGGRLHEELPEMGALRVRVLGAFQTAPPSRHRPERALRPAAGRRTVPDDHGANPDSQGRCAG